MKPKRNILKTIGLGLLIAATSLYIGCGPTKEEKERIVTLQKDFKTAYEKDAHLEYAAIENTFYLDVLNALNNSLRQNESEIIPVLSQEYEKLAKNTTRYYDAFKNKKQPWDTKRYEDYLSQSSKAKSFLEKMPEPNMRVFFGNDTLYGTIRDKDAQRNERLAELYIKSDGDLSEIAGVKRKYELSDIMKSEMEQELDSTTVENVIQNMKRHK